MLLSRIIWKIFWVHLAKWSSISLWVFLWNRKNVFLWEGASLWLAYHIAVSEKGSLTIGRWTNINRFFTCGASDRVSIGEDCLISYGVSIQSGNHSFSADAIPGSGADDTAPISIGDRCFIGCGAVILKWVTLGNNCVVWANAVVTKPFPDRSIIAGNPAICIKTL